MATQLDHYRLLGRSGLRVSPLALGTMTFGYDGWGTPAAQAQAMVDLYLDRGGNFIDTANFYAAGQSESILGQAIKGKREQVVLATKYSLTMQPGSPNASGNQRKNLVQSVEASLNRLGTDCIDLLFLHMWDDMTPVEEVLRGFDDLVRAGKILYAGISDTPAWQIARMQAIADLRGWSPFIALQVPYNLSERSVELEFMPMAKTMGLGVLPWSPLAGGVLSGKYSRADLDAANQTQSEGTSARKNINLATGRLNEQTLAIADEVVAIAAEIECTPAQVALAWTLENSAVTAPIVGARTENQLVDNLNALDITFTSAHLQRLNNISQIDSCFPHNMINQPTGNMMLGNVTVVR